jgi:MFS family permease
MVEQTDPKLQKKLKRTLTYSALDGGFYSAMVGFGESMFGVFATFLKATSFQLGLIGSLPQTIGSILQIFSSKIMKLFPNRKRYVLFGSLIQLLIFLPLPFVSKLFGENAFYATLLLICLYWIGGMMINPAWTSWMGDLVPENIRGTYFGRRNAIAGFSAFITMIFASILMSFFTNDQLTGFTSAFYIAAFARFMSMTFLTLKYEPEFNQNTQEGLSLREFISGADTKNYGIFVALSGFMNLAVFIAAPFFTIYMKNDLGYSYTTIIIINAIMIFAKFIFNPVWGKLCDKFSSRRIFQFSAFTMPLVPILWLFSPNLTIIILIQIFSGFVWSAYEVSYANFIYEMVPRNKRVSSIAYFNFFVGIGVLAGGMLGGLMVSHNELFWSKYHIVFLISGLARYTVSFIFFPRIKETKLNIVESVSSKNLLLEVLHSTMSTTGIANFAMPNKPKEKIIIEEYIELDELFDKAKEDFETNNNLRKERDDNDT